MSAARRPVRDSRAYLHLEALAWIIRVRLALSARKLDTLRSATLPRDTTAFRLQPGVLRVVRAVSRMARLVPKASCLTQANAAQIMLARRRVPSTIQIGVSDADGFEAHAWLEVADTVVLGGDAETPARYSRLTTYGPSLS